MGVGHGRGTTARGRTVGHRGNSNRRGVPPDRRVGTAGAPAPVGAAVVVPGVGRTRLSGRGTHQRAKPPPNIPAAIGKRKFDGGHQNQGDIKRRYGAAAAAALGNLGNNWGSQPLPQQPLGTNGGEQWYTDTYSVWS